MNFNKIALFTTLTCVAFIVQCTFFTPKKEGFTLLHEIKTTKDLKKLFPQTIEDITSLAQSAVEEAQKGVQEILSIPIEQKTFQNTVEAFDQIHSNFMKVFRLFELLTLITPDVSRQTEATQQFVFLQKQNIDLFGQNKDLYNAINDYANNNAHNENLNEEERYFLTETLQNYIRAGLNLSDEKRQQVIALEKQLTELTTKFGENIYADTKTIEVTVAELSGLDDDFIKNLKKTDTGLYILGTDYPTYYKILSFGSVSSTRKKIYEIFNNRGYPENCAVLNKLIETRHQLAELLGFGSYAHLTLSNEMVQTPEHAEQFLNDLIIRAQKKETIEYQQLINNLPTGVSLSAEGKIYPWDRNYLIELYKKNNFNLDENLIAQYFPMDNTIKELLDIYQQFLDLEIKEEPINGLWHPDIKLVTVHQNKQLIGYLLLDLYPRANKFNHACQLTVIPAIKGSSQPAVGVVIANFPKATATQPSLLKRGDAKTFFHEFGHALHAVLGATKIEAFSGTNVKTDFVEMPSQMLEEWLGDAEILKKVSHHYQTGEPLSDEIIQTLIELKNISSGNDLQKQLWLALISLNYFKEGSHKDIHAIFKELAERIKPHDVFYDECHFYASFGHLTGYGAKYYSYLWSRVFALDLFNYIKTYGLLNPEIGIKYKNTILAPGGSKDPNELLQDFLGRAPNSDAFMHDLGL